MRNISFALTTEQVRNQTKTVTRRTGWKTLKPGTLLQPVMKGMGLKKGDTVEKIGGPIRVVKVGREPLSDLAHPLREDAAAEVDREGFLDMSPQEFVAMFRKHNGLKRDCFVTRIEFEYLPEGQ